MSVILCNASNRRNVRQSLESLHHERRVRGSAEYYVAEEIGAGVMSGSFRWHIANGQGRQDGNDTANSRA